MFDKNIELTFNSKGGYHYLKDHIYTWMPIPRFQCRDFQLAFLSVFNDKDIKDFYLKNEWIQKKKKTISHIV